MADISNSKLLATGTGILDIQDACIIIVKTEWNNKIIDELENGCKAEFQNRQITNINTITVPGAVEIPFAVKNYWEQVQAQAAVNKIIPDAFIALGCVIRGGTPHFEYVCKIIADGVLHLNLNLPVPTVFGVLTVDNEEQAIQRTGGIHGHKGKEAAITAMKMITFNRLLKK
jgi:6,7-dimethyl-8-ribityllumazine synthase